MKILKNVIILHMCIMCMVPYLGYFLPFYHPPHLILIPKIKFKKMLGDIILLYIHVYHKWRSYDIWFLKYKVQQTDIFTILGHFFVCPFSPLIEKSKFYHWEKALGDIIILLMCTKYDNLMTYGSWDIERNRHNFLSFGTILCPFTQKIKILKKMKKMLGDITILHKWGINDNHMIRG